MIETCLRVLGIFLLTASFVWGCQPLGDDDDNGDDDDTAGGTPYCWTVAPVSGQLAVIEVDMDAGTWTEYGRYGQAVNSSFHTGGLARSGDTLVMAAYLGNNFQWMELDMAADTIVRGSDTDNVSVSIHDQEFIALGYHHQDVHRYADFDALNYGNPSSTITMDPHASRLGVCEDELYTAWHSTNELDVYDPTTGAYLHTLPLDDFDTWVWGISMVGGQVHVIDDGRGAYMANGTRIASFDPVTGANTGNVFIDFAGTEFGPGPAGLWCEAY